MDRAPEKPRVGVGLGLDSGDTCSPPEAGSASDHGIASSGASQAHAEVIERLNSLLISRQEEFDLAIMQVIASGDSPAEWFADMLRLSVPESAQAEPRRPVFLGMDDDA